MQGEKNTPGPAQADRPRSGPFAELLRRAEHDGEACAAFALAYAEQPTQARRQLIQATLEDLTAPQQLLATLLSVEDNAALASILASELTKGGLKPGHLDLGASLEGDEDAGEATLVQGLFGGFVERLHIAWDNRRIRRVEVEPLVHLKSVATNADPRRVADRLAPMLLRYVRGGGKLPSTARRFARFFSVHTER